VCNSFGGVWYDRDMRIQKTIGVEASAQLLSTRIREKLSEGKSVLFLIPGGSAIAVALLVARELVTMGDLTRLSVMLTDERFGEVGHKDSNWAQLTASGFSLPRATLIPTLRGLSLSETVHAQEEVLRAQFSGTDFHVGLFGMGSDGHTAGILPGSPASTSTALVVGYPAPQFTRITMTPSAIAQLDLAVLYAMGGEKKKAVQNLSEEKDIAVQPAQALKKARELVVFTDAV
jgi:6-phosphogluconolactonase/glucosamine-6-phosphate isomerase/deaminase